MVIARRTSTRVTSPRVLLAFLAAALVLMGSLAPPARAQAQPAPLPTAADKKVGPVDPGNGFPFWYEDSDGMRLELCQVEAYCLLELPSPGQPVTFPDNFGPEQFWWSGEASIARADGGRALLVMAQEAAFTNEEPKTGDQAAFGRIRVRLDQLKPNTTYKVTHPYGTESLVTEADGSIFFTEDIGCALPTPTAPCAENNRFAQSLNSRIAGPFLTWDTFGNDPNGTDPALAPPPAGFVGDPTVDHKVKGSPLGTNFFKVEELDDDGNVVGLLGETDQFAVSGKLAAPQASADLGSGTYNTPRSVKIVSASDPADDPAYRIYYTTATTEPDATGNTAVPEAPTPNPDDASQLYTGAIPVGREDGVQKVNLKFVVVDEAGNSSPVEEETYTIDAVAPTVTATPGPGAKDAPLTGDGAVTLAANKANAQIFYTTDGSDPKTSAAAREYAAPIDVPRSQTIKAYAVTTDSAGKKLAGETETFGYTIASLAKVGPKNPMGNFPFWYQDHEGTKLELCLDPNDQMCLQPFEMPDPARPVSFPKNFPGEAFWWAADASVAANGGADAQLVMAQEAAFANEEPRNGDQMSFGRIRVRVDNLVAGRTYKVTHPYGVDTYVAEPVRAGSAVGEINVTEDLGCFPAPGEPCDFNDARFGRVGPFLTWDTFGNDPNTTDPALAPPPAGYVGDPTLEAGHKVKGSPLTDASGRPQNYFKVEGPNAGGPGNNVLQTDLFSVSGKVAAFKVSASHATGSYNNANEPLNVTLGASEEGAKIFYTTNGSTPSVDAGGAGTGTEYAGPVGINDTTTLKFVAARQDATTGAWESSPVVTETYTIDNDAPTVGADPAGGTFDNETGPITLSSNEPGEIFYTTNGSNPANELNRSRTLFDPATPINLTRTTTLRFVAIDAAGNLSPVGQEVYTVNDTVAPATPTVRLAAASDTGASNTDSITRSTTLTLNGTTDPDTQIQILDGADVIGTVTTNASGQFGFTTAQLSQGVHVITAKATDGAGNSSTSGELRVTVDTTAPDTNITSGPSGTVNATQASFGFDSTEANSSFRCSLDGAAFAACTSPRAYANLANRAHTFRVQATDAAGNADASAATRTWTVDTTRPTITRLTPANGARNVARATNVVATFSERVTNATATTVRLTRPNGTVVPATITLNAAGTQVTLNPNANLAAGTRYTLTVVGGANGIKDAAGNPLAQNQTSSFTTN